MAIQINDDVPEEGLRKDLQITRSDGTVIDYSKPVGLSDDTPVRILTFTSIDTSTPLLIEYFAKEGVHIVAAYRLDGLSRDPKYTLKNIPKRYKVTRWMNIYASVVDSYHEAVSLHSKRADADSAADSRSRMKRVACVKIELDVKDGEGLEEAQPPVAGETREIDMSE